MNKIIAIRETAEALYKSGKDYNEIVETLKNLGVHLDNIELSLIQIRLGI